MEELWFFFCCFMKADHVAFSQFDITYHGHIRLDTPFEPHGKIPHFGICRWLSNQKSTDLTTASTMGMICVYSTKNRDIAQACSKKVQTYSKQQEKSIKQQNLTRKSSIKDGGNIIKKEIEISHVMFKHSWPHMLMVKPHTLLIIPFDSPNDGIAAIGNTASNSNLGVKVDLNGLRQPKLMLYMSLHIGWCWMSIFGACLLRI